MIALISLFSVLGAGAYYFFVRPRRVRVKQERPSLTPQLPALACAAAGLAIWDWDRHKNFFCSSAVLDKLLGLKEDELKGADKKWIGLLHSHDKAQILADFDSHAVYKNQSFRMEFRMRHQAGHYIWLELNATMIGERCIGLAGEITARKKIEQNLWKGALYDPLTGLANRALLLDRIQRQMDKGDKGFALALFHIHDFTALNESLGHRGGDQFLLIFAERFTCLLPKGASLARIGRDQFAFISPPDFSALMADFIKTLCRKLKQNIRIELPSSPALPHDEIGSPAPPHDGIDDISDVTPRFVVAWADYQPNRAKAEDLMNDSEIALREAHKTGERVHFNPHRHHSSSRRVLLDADLRHALARDEMVLYYQPIIRLDDYQISGFEALMRWRHPKFGLISPLEFIPLAEENGLIELLGHFAMSQAALNLSQWQIIYHYQPPLFASVNLSRQELFREDLANDIRHIIKSNHLKDGQLMIEITENLMMRRPDRVSQILSQCQAVGAHIAIDDFGAGYSSLGWLQNMPFNIIKLDRSLIGSCLEDDSKSAAIIKAMIEMAHNMGVKIIAEGVDDSKKGRWLKDMGCDLAQGFFYAHPMDERKLRGFLPRHRLR